MLEHSTTVRAETVEKATEKGLAELNISLEQADVHVISEGKKGLFGFGKQDAIVEITVKNNLSLSEITEQLEEEQKSKNAAENISVPSEPIRVEVEETAVVEEVEDPIEEETVEEVIQPTVVEAEVEPAVKEEPITEIIEVEDVTEEEDEVSDNITIEEASQKVAAYIQSVIKEYGAHADVDYEITRSQVMFNIDTDKSGLVIGKHGKIINSLQILSQTYFQSLYRRRTSVLLNVGDYRDRRASVLKQIAQRTADEVLNTKQPVILDPLPSYERKQIHAHLARIDHIKTHSEGKEPNRYLVVEYK